MSEVQTAKQDENRLGLKAKILMLVGIPVIVIIVCSFVIYYAAQSIVTNEVYDDDAVSYELPENGSDAEKFVFDRLSVAVSGKEVKASRSTSVEIGELSGNASDAQMKLIEYIRGSIQGGISSKYEGASADYGEDVSFLSEITPIDGVADFSVQDNEGTAEFVFRGEGAEFASDRAAAEDVLAGLSDVFEVKKNEMLPESVTLTAKIEMEREQIKEVNVARTYNVSLDVEFTGDYKELGEQSFTFVYTVRDNYPIAHAGIKIVQDEISINKNGYEAVNLEANVSENVSNDEFSLTYEISDESVATVDENGQIDAVSESKTPVTVTATLEYLGKTYTDTCLVYVTKKVDTITMKPHTAKLTAGETIQLSVKFDPSDATIQDITWFSEDESIATVDENGLVTAVAPGNVKIVAVALDGNLMTACSVTVNG